MSTTRTRGFLSRRYSAVLAAGAALALLAGCASGAPADEGTNGGSSDAALAGETIAFVGYGDTSPWGAYFNSVYVPAVEAEGADVLDLTTMDPGEQVQNFNQAIAENPSMIVAILLDTAAMVGPMSKALDAGISVLIVDGPADPRIADHPDLLSVLSDNVALGEFAAENLIEGMKGQGLTEGNVIVISGTQAMLVTQERMEGFNEVFDANPGFEILEVQDGNWDPALSGKLAQQLLAKYGQDGVQGAYGMADYMAIPIIEAAKQLGFELGGEDGLIVSGGNCFAAGIEAIRAGDMYGTATEDPGTIAEKTATYTIDYLTGKNPPKTVVMEEHRVTADNLDEFGERCSKA